MRMEHDFKNHRTSAGSGVGRIASDRRRPCGRLRLLGRAGWQHIDLLAVPRGQRELRDVRGGRRIVRVGWDTDHGHQDVRRQPQKMLALIRRNKPANLIRLSGRSVVPAPVHRDAGVLACSSDFDRGGHHDKTD